MMLPTPMSCRKSHALETRYSIYFNISCILSFVQVTSCRLDLTSVCETVTIASRSSLGATSDLRRFRPKLRGRSESRLERALHKQADSMYLLTYCLNCGGFQALSKSSGQIPEGIENNELVKRTFQVGSVETSYPARLAAFPC